ncbi:ABC1 kinase family protein [Dermatobacter hominis]|uniref:ABC1 kinase family protein n=1 Tax=Dermatobacter hominis TaxID=2884263 RepID=UPI001D10C2C6|nr:AarF/ABC1/UbiB kinase family protein [Dermatobacter hominis]UDY36492.1 AarF/ABC1/UbiB kinase family protein [Dermatobacter hominis]
MRRGRALALAGAVAGAAGAAAALVAATRRDGVRADQLRRTATMARMGARTGTSYVSMRARSALADEERRKELADEFQLRSAEQVAEMLGGMKGALMKLGQMASYLDQGLPEPVREALAELQQNAPPMAPELVEQVVRAELGGAPEQVFAEWDPVPLAAASIGQVHRAVTWDGAAVAVKVQYPGVDRAVAADLENTDLLFNVMGLLFPGMDPGPIVAELRERLVEELDYRIEAAHQRIFVDHYRGHPYIHVPAVFDELSTARVLTTELVQGAPFSEVVGWPDEERQLAAECLYRFAFGGIYQLHAFNGDPHPGNYLFHPGGRITFLDFGLCKRFTPDEVRDFEDMIRAMVLDRDIPRFRRVIERIGLLSPDLVVSDDELVEYFGHFYEFVMEPSVVEITPEWSSDSVRRFFDLSGPHAEIMKAANLPPSMVIVQRINMGLFALFGDLRARANWRAIAEEIWPFADGPPSTPMGERIAEWERDRAQA